MDKLLHIIKKLVHQAKDIPLPQKSQFQVLQRKSQAQLCRHLRKNKNLSNIKSLHIPNKICLISLNPVIKKLKKHPNRKNKKMLKMLNIKRPLLNQKYTNIILLVKLHLNLINTIKIKI